MCSQENQSAVKRSDTTAVESSPMITGPRSKSVSDIVNEVDEDKPTETSKQTPKLTREHWRKGKMLQKCHGCRCRIICICARHHCRMCGDIFCNSCSRYRKRLNESGLPDMDGQLHRVCLSCGHRNEDTTIHDIDQGRCKSWTEEYLAMRAQHRHKIGLKERKPVDELVCEVSAVCLPIIDQYLDDVTKEKPKAARKMIHNVMKATKRDKTCYSCNRSLLIPKNRKECSLCGVVSCKKCSSKDLVVYWPRGTENTHESTQPRIEIMRNVEDVSEKADVWQNYRVCDPCKSHMDDELNEYDFNHDLQVIYSGLTSIRSQIITKLGEPRYMSYSTASLCTNSNDVSQKTGDNILDQLLSQYYTCFSQLSSLKPRKNKQRNLVKNILSAARMFYFEKIRQFQVPSSAQSEEQVAI